VRNIYPDEKESHQLGYEIIPAHKIISELPKNVHETWTLETYQEEAINQIDLTAFHCFCLYNHDGIIIANEKKEICFTASWDFLSNLGVVIE